MMIDGDSKLFSLFIHSLRLTDQTTVDSYFFITNDLSTYSRRSFRFRFEKSQTFVSPKIDRSLRFSIELSQKPQQPQVKCDFLTWYRHRRRAE